MLMVKEAGGVVNDISNFDQNSINIRAANSSIYEQMLKNLVNF